MVGSDETGGARPLLTAGRGSGGNRRTAPRTFNPEAHMKKRNARELVRWAIVMVVSWALAVGLPKMALALDLLWWTRE